MTEIPFWVHTQPKWVSGISKHTTCSDILTSLAKADIENSENRLCPLDQLTLVEQWRAVERPLNNSSRILKLWQAWGEQQGQVRFVVKRLSRSSSSEVSPLPITAGESRRPKRRTSNLNDRHNKTKTTAKTKGVYQSSHPYGYNEGDVERLMKVIQRQGDTIRAQLKRLQDNEGQIESIEEQVHKCRTKSVGKDYLTKSYLRKTLRSSSSSSDLSDVDKERSDSGVVEELIKSLENLNFINVKLCKVENDLFRLETEQSILPEHAKERDDDNNTEDYETASNLAIQELSQLRQTNDKVNDEISKNHNMISSMKSLFRERQSLLERLEADILVMDTDCLKIQTELCCIDSMNEEENDGHLGSTSDLNNLTIRTSPSLPLLIYPSDNVISTRLKTTGSPSSSSGNSSGSSEKNVRFHDDIILSNSSSLALSSKNTQYCCPETRKMLPNFSEIHETQKSATNFASITKSILKAVDLSCRGKKQNLSYSCNNLDNIDSNSDTGLSSLHSSGDECCTSYVLDTLV